MQVKGTRLCKNRECDYRFTPKNINHQYHNDNCRRTAIHKRTDIEVLADELGVETQEPTILLSEAFSKKNEILRENERLRALREYIKFEIREASGNKYLKFNKNLPDVHSSSSALLLIASDWQLGKMENGIGVEETQRRINKFISSALSIADKHQVDYIHLQYDGDMSEGCYIYRGQNVTGLDRTGNTHRLTVQLKTTAEAMAWVAKKLGEHYIVLVNSVPGNHGRPNGINDFADKEDNFDTMCAWWAEDITLPCTNVSWDISDHWCQEYEILGKNVLALHGDQWTGPLDKFDTLLPQWIATHYVKRPDIVLLGHRHQFEVRTIGDITVIQNGTIDGGSNWYTKAYGRASRPIQTAMIISKEHGLESIYPIYF